ncbi:MAG: VOC family protein [Tatlockia sp.]|nr:VOC family protein [Tatlockia sp.]
MIIDHIGIAVSDYEKSKKFYINILTPFGIEPMAEHEGWVGFGKNNKPEFWLGPGKDTKYFMHFAFAADTKEIVDAFYKIAIEEGAVCNGKPKIREDYYSGYYGAFIIDYDGHSISAIVHNP